MISSTLQPPTRNSRSFTGDAVLVKSDLETKRKAEIQALDRSQLTKLLGPLALDESQGHIPLADLAIVNRYSGCPPWRGGNSQEFPKTEDGSTSLDHPGYEAVAQFWATDRHLRKFRSIGDLAKHFDVERTTVGQWMQETKVSQRIDWLTNNTKNLAQLMCRRSWPTIVAAQVEKAEAGDTRAACFCRDVAWVVDPQATESKVSAEQRLRAAIIATENSGDLPTWIGAESEADVIDIEVEEKLLEERKAAALQPSSDDIPADTGRSESSQNN